MGLAPGLRQTVKTLFGFHEKQSTGKTTVAQNDLRLAKRKRALLESNPPRNNQPETHRDDEAGGGACAVPGPVGSHRIGLPFVVPQRLRTLPAAHNRWRNEAVSGCKP